MCRTAKRPTRTKGCLIIMWPRYRAQQNPAVRVPKNSLVEMYESFGENYKLCSSVDGTLLVI